MKEHQNQQVQFGVPSEGPPASEGREQPTRTMDPRPYFRQRVTRRRMMKIGAFLAAFGVGAGWGWHNGHHSFVYRGHRTAVNGVAWSPDGKRMASCSHDGSTQIWDASDGGNASSNYLLTTKWTDQEIPVTAAAWSPDSMRIAITSAAGDVFAWGDEDSIFEDASWMVAEATPHSPAMNALAWSPGGRRIAAACADGTIQIWTGLDEGPFVPNEPPSLVYRDYRAPVNALAWSPDGGRIVSGSQDGTVRIWDTTTGVIDRTAQVLDSNTITSANEAVQLHVAAITAVAWSPDGWDVLYANEDGWVSLWNINEDKTANSSLWDGGRINAVAWSPDGGRFALGLQNGAIEIWSPASAFGSDSSEPLARYQRHRKAVNALAWSPDGSAIASASSDTTVQVGYLRWWG